jgi:hypothetical protein
MSDQSAGLSTQTTGATGQSQTATDQDAGSADQSTETAVPNSAPTGQGAGTSGENTGSTSQTAGATGQSTGATSQNGGTVGQATGSAGSSSNGSGTAGTLDLTKSMKETVQGAAAALRTKEAGLWVFGDPVVEARWRALVQDGYRFLSADPPNLTAAQQIIARVERAIASEVYTQANNRIWQMRSIAVLAALTLLLLFAAWAVPWASNIMGLPIWILLLGGAGGAASGLVALRTPISIASNRRILVPAAFSRAVLGALTGGLAYSLVASGAVAMAAPKKANLFYVFIALAGGYSERLLGQLAERAEALVGGRPAIEGPQDLPKAGADVKTAGAPAPDTP